MPAEIEKKYPNLWVNEDVPGNKNQNEHQLLDNQLKRYGINIKTTYHKVLNATYGKRMIDNLSNMMS